MALTKRLKKAGLARWYLNGVTVNDFFTVELFDPKPGLLFCGFRHKWDDCPFKFSQRPSKDFFKRRIQIRDGIVQIEDKHRIRQKFQECAIALFSAETRYGRLGTGLVFHEKRYLPLTAPIKMNIGEDCRCTRKTCGPPLFPREDPFMP